MAIITLTTDFGLADHYVGVMKGVILGLAPGATIVDITHEVTPQNLYQGAVVLAEVIKYFPPGTTHVVVVDPGVGTQRRVLAVETQAQVVLAPDNGLATLLLEAVPTPVVRGVEVERWSLPLVSRTFHGRDVFAPVAARLATGLPAASLGPVVTDAVRLSWPRPRVGEGSVEGQVLYADRFGNLITNIGEGQLAETGLGGGATGEIAGRTCPVVGTFGDARPGEAVALVGSSGLVEVSVVQGDAARVLGAGPGTRVRLTRRR